MNEQDKAALLEAVRATVKETLAAETKTAEPAKPAVEVVPEQKNAGIIVTANEVQEPWRRRVAKYFNSFVAEKQGNMEKALSIRAELANEVRSMSAFQKAEEDREMKDIVSSASLNPVQQKRLLSTLTDAAGNLLLPKPFLAEVFVIVEQYGVARRYLRSVPMVSKTLDLKNIATKPTAYWVDEGSNITQSDITFGSGQLVTKKLAGLAIWSSELIEDEAIAALPLLSMLFGEAIFKLEDQAALLGDGTSNFGSFTGMTVAAGFSQVLAAGSVTYASVTADDLRKTINKLSVSSRQGAMWFLHPDILMNVELLKDNYGRYIYRQPGDTNGPATLWGYPIVESQVMPNNADANQKNVAFAAFGNPQWGLMGTRRDMTAELSREAVIQAANGTILYNTFQADGAAIRLTERIGFNYPLANRFAVIKTAAA